eukprot:Mycagemm_TRINITY_DN10324_c2_g1::TRINITY_DN10324_c2_g1_i1::g.1013::m.1013 type:complete len:219 gc:universal TRINITY_DN10324_c2_g1_i1:826-170(-)
MRAGCLDRVKVPILQEHINDEVTARRVIKEYKQTPVDEPCPLLQLCYRRAKVARVDCFPQGVQIVERVLPVEHQNFASKLAPQCREVAVSVCTEETIEEEVISGSGVVTAVELELGIAEQRLETRRGNLLLGFEMLHREGRVGELLPQIGVVNDAQDGRCLLLKLVVSCEHLGALLLHFLYGFLLLRKLLGRGLILRESFIRVRSKIKHVSLAEKLQL